MSRRAPRSRNVPWIPRALTSGVAVLALVVALIPVGTAAASASVPAMSAETLTIPEEGVESPAPAPAPTPGDDEAQDGAVTPDGDAEAPDASATPETDGTDSDGAQDDIEVQDDTAPHDEVDAAEDAQAEEVDALSDAESFTLAGFRPGNIISDAVFTDATTMTESQIQAFFDSKVKTCRGGSDKYGPIVCLKDFTITSVDRPADKYCDGYKGAPNESAARIIYRAAISCDINPEVLIVMLQKEQGLVTHTWPSAWRYDKALGQGCPDGGVPCNPAYVGFFHQIYGAARQMQIYMEGRYFTWYAPGKTWNILYHPNRACGTAPVHVENKATSALYYYTPYQPNAAALRAGYGTGDSCSSYGNRNFYNYFTDWFGSTQISHFTQSPPVIEGHGFPGQRLTAIPKFSPQPSSTTFQWLRNGAAIAGATQNRYDLRVADAGKSITVRVVAKRNGYVDATAVSAALAVGHITVDRAAGIDREQTAVAASRLASPDGASTVYLATSQHYADALSAAPAAVRADGSLLISNPDRLGAAVGQELKRLAPKRIVLLGGPAVLSKRLFEQVAATVPGATVSRTYGADRYATSRLIAESTGTNDAVVIATGTDFPDALSAAAAGSVAKRPVLLVHGDRTAIDTQTRATITRLKAKTVTIVGGPGAVSPQIEAALRGLGLTVTRLSGTDRYDTNAAVNAAFFQSKAPRVLIASGQDFPDALSASALAGRLSAPMLLARDVCVPVKGADFIRDRGATRATLVGGPGVLSESGVGQLRRCG